MLKSMSQQQAVWAIFAITLVTILSAWAFEYAGYLPCELCLKQRYAYYAAIPLSLIIALFGAGRPAILRYGLGVLGLIMLASCIFGIFHAGVEWKFWQGPTACTASNTIRNILPDLTRQAVMCDQAAIRILGLSLAGWNAVISAGTSWLGFIKMRSIDQPEL